VIIGIVRRNNKLVEGHPGIEYGGGLSSCCPSTVLITVSFVTVQVQLKVLCVCGKELPDDHLQFYRECSITIGLS